MSPTHPRLYQTLNQDIGKVVRKKEITDEEARALAVLKSTLTGEESKGGKTAPAWINAIRYQTVSDASDRFARAIEKLLGVRKHFGCAAEDWQAVPPHRP